MSGNDIPGEFVISHAGPSDVGEIREISIQTFSETFSELNTKRDMKKYLDENFNSVKILSEVNTTGSEFFLVKKGGETAGYLKLNMGDAQNEKTGENCIEIERLYVAAKFKRRGIGKLMMNKAIQRAREISAGCIWLGVWELNHDARAFYDKFGFKKFGEHIFMLGNDVQTDWLMKLEL